MTATLAPLTTPVTTPMAQRPEIVRETSAAGAISVEQRLSFAELAYRQSWLRKVVVLAALALFRVARASLSGGEARLERGVQRPAAPVVLQRRPYTCTRPAVVSGCGPRPRRVAMRHSPETDSALVGAAASADAEGGG